MGTLSFRKAYGALKDTTKVGLAKVNSEFKELDIAIVKATNHVECPPKERHVRCIFSATSVIRPRTDVAYCIHALAKRLSKTKNWIVALKVLIVIHRALREGDPTFRDELLSYSRRGSILQISNFKDDSSATAWDCSAWTRAYALFLEERLECYRVLKYDIETERLTKTSPGASKVHSRTRLLNGEELLEQLPALQQLLNRLIGCQPDGEACCTYLVQYALALVLKESFKIYCAINDGIINLVDIFFDMSRHDAVTALDIYKRAGKQAESLSEFYEYCKSLDITRTFQFPTLRQPPPSFLATMEEYIKEAPNFGSIPKRLEFQERDASPKKSEEPSDFTKEEEQVDEEEENQKEAAEPKEEEAPESPPLIAVDDKADFLGLSEAADPRAAAELEEYNALALEIAQPGNENASSSSGASTELGTTGWELSLATTPSNNISHIGESKLGGGFDKLLLDSLYEDDAARRQIQYQNAGYGTDGGMDLHNPFEQQDPFVMSNSIVPPANVQIAMTMLQQQQQQQLQYQQMTMQQQHNQSLPMVPYGHQQPQYPCQQMQQPMSASNPFGDAFSSLPQNPAPQQGHNVLLQEN